jgi:hypothetical protein
MNSYTATAVNSYVHWQPSITNKLALETFGVMPHDVRQVLLRDCRSINEHITLSVMHRWKWSAVTPLHFLELFRRFFEEGYALRFMRRLYVRLKTSPVALKRVRALLAKSVAWMALKAIVKLAIVKVLGIGEAIVKAFKYLYDLICGVRSLS